MHYDARMSNVFYDSYFFQQLLRLVGIVYVSLLQAHFQAMQIRAQVNTIEILFVSLTKLQALDLQRPDVIDLVVGNQKSVDHIELFDAIGEHALKSALMVIDLLGIIQYLIDLLFVEM